MSCRTRPRSQAAIHFGIPPLSAVQRREDQQVADRKSGLRTDIRNHAAKRTFESVSYLMYLPAATLATPYGARQATT